MCLHVFRYKDIAHLSGVFICISDTQIKVCYNISMENQTEQKEELTVRQGESGDYFFRYETLEEEPEPKKFVPFYSDY